MINNRLKGECIIRFGSETETARRAGMQLSRLSLIIRGHLRPTEKDVAKLAKVFGADEIRRLL